MNETDTWQPLPPEVQTQLCTILRSYARAHSGLSPQVQEDTNGVAEILAGGWRRGELVLEDLEIANELPIGRALLFLGQRARGHVLAAQRTRDHQWWKLGGEPPAYEQDGIGDG